MLLYSVVPTEAGFDITSGKGFSRAQIASVAFALQNQVEFLSMNGEPISKKNANTKTIRVSFENLKDSVIDALETPAFTEEKTIDLLGTENYFAAMALNWKLGDLHSIAIGENGHMIYDSTTPISYVVFRSREDLVKFHENCRVFKELYAHNKEPVITELENGKLKLNLFALEYENVTPRQIFIKTLSLAMQNPGDINLNNTDGDAFIKAGTTDSHGLPSYIEATPAELEKLYTALPELKMAVESAKASEFKPSKSM